MDGLTLLNDARAAGLLVMVEGDLLKIRGPRQIDAVVRGLIANKQVVLNALATEKQAPEPQETAAAGRLREAGGS